ncbi:MAG: aspartyl protease family protein [Deltaproteobacteria bacterium]|nr:aspartyl protease family protein [Deltaproteobacteria bacterium]
MARPARCSALAALALALILGEPAAAAEPRGPRSGTLPVWRTEPTGTKLFVEAELGDGVPRLFLVDTGASISVLNPEVAAALGIDGGPTTGELVGLGGRARYRLAQVPTLHLGPFSLDGVDFAVGHSGLPRRAGLVPIDGIIGNNVWGEFQFVVDYPANLLELHRPNTLRLPPDAVPMAFDGQHASTSVTVIVDLGGEELRQTVPVDVDTGGRGLLLNGAVPGPWDGLARQGEELIFGVGAGDELPAHNFLRSTRRAPIAAVEIGGVRVTDLGYVTWFNFDVAMRDLGPARMPGLLGHEALDDHRVVFDFPGQRFALLPSTRPPAERLVTTWALRHHSPTGPANEVAAERALWLQAADRPAAARRVLRRALRKDPEDDALRVLSARLRRHQGAPEAADEVLRPLSPARLVDHGELVAVVNAAVLEGDLAGAARLAHEGVRARPTSAHAWVALSDAERWRGAYPEARSALREANRLDQAPDGHLLRRAWISELEGDLWAASAHLSRLLQLHPHSGPSALYLAMIAEGSAAEVVLDEQLAAARARLHLGEGPLDYHAAALAVSGDADGAAALATAGIARDCADPARPRHSRANCEAWYLALARAELDRARGLSDEALAHHPRRGAYLDTRATVAEARGEPQLACAAALAAARTDPDDLYLLWQAWRRAQACRTAPTLAAGAPPTPPLPSPLERP